MNPVVRTVEPDQVRDSAGELKAGLQTLAQDLGFDLCRIAAANPPAHAGEFRSWLHEGAAGETVAVADDPITLPAALDVEVIGWADTLRDKSVHCDNGVCFTIPNKRS